MAETTGQYLKRTFGVSSFPNVFVTKLMGLSNARIFVIVYDSKRPDATITNELIRHSPFFYFVKAPFEQKITLSSLVPIEEWDRNLAPGVFLVQDLSGRFANLANLDQHFGEMTLGDFKSKASASIVTQTFRQIRNKKKGPENRLAKLTSIAIDEDEGSVTFKFKTVATDDNQKHSEVDPFTFSIVSNPKDEYELQIKVLKFFDWLETAPVGTVLTVKDLKDVLAVADVQFWSTSPSFHWQGMNYMLSQVNASIYPTDIAPKVWNHIHGQTYFFDKHLFGLARSISFFIPQMAAKLSAILKSKGYL